MFFLHETRELASIKLSSSIGMMLGHGGRGCGEADVGEVDAGEVDRQGKQTDGSGRRGSGQMRGKLTQWVRTRRV